MPDAGAKGSVVHGYNCQAAVDATVQIIVAADVTDEANDKQQAQPMLTQVLVNTEQMPRTVTMDAGYISARRTSRPSRRWAVGHSSRRIANSMAKPCRWLLVDDRQRDCRRRTLRTRRGRRCYAQRKAIVEPVFGQIKQGRSYRQFLLRGMRQVSGEWALICTTHNLLKLWTALRRRHRRPGEELRALSGSRKVKRRGQR